MMQSYPFTSQVTYDEQDLPVYDRAVDSSFLREVFARYFSDGIFYKPTNAFQVLVGTGMNVLVNPGACHIQGAIGIEKSQRTLSIQAAETMDRIDTIVLRLDLSLAARSIDLYVVKGSSAASPQAPSLTRNSTIWELGIANIFVAKNTTSVTQQRITDTRLNGNRCGIVAQTIGALDTSPYFAQVQAMIAELEQTISGIENGSGYVFSLEGKSGNLLLGDIGAVPVTRTINGKPLNANISLSAGDVGAAAFSSGTWTPKAQGGAVSTDRQGVWYKFDKLVFISAHVLLNKSDTPNEEIRLIGLPFSPVFSPNGIHSLTIGTWVGFNNVTSMQANILGTGPYVRFPVNGTNSLKGNHILEQGQIVFSGFYVART